MGRSSGVAGPLSAAGWARSPIPPASNSPSCQNAENYDKGDLVVVVLIEDVFPDGITIELLDAVTDEMGVDASLTPGGFVHVHFEKDGLAHGVDVWDSVEPMSSSSSRRSCPPWPRLPRREASIRRR
jgi:hypothetical protein